MPCGSCLSPCSLVSCLYGNMCRDFAGQALAQLLKSCGIQANMLLGCLHRLCSTCCCKSPPKVLGSGSQLYKQLYDFAWTQDKTRQEDYTCSSQPG